MYPVDAMPLQGFVRLFKVLANFYAPDLKRLNVLFRQLNSAFGEALGIGSFFPYAPNVPSDGFLNRVQPMNFLFSFTDGSLCCCGQGFSNLQQPFQTLDRRLELIGHCAGYSKLW